MASINRALVADLYVRGNLSMRKIGYRLGRSEDAVRRALLESGVEPRHYTSAQFCWCGKPVQKRWKKRSDGYPPSLTGTLCREHAAAKRRSQ